MRLVLILGLVWAGLSSAANLEVMSYNVENLFDAVHDEGKDDWTSTPKGTPGKAEYCEKIRNQNYKEECLKSDWTEAKVRLKIRQIQRALTTRAALPDILGLVEIENEAVVGQLAEALGYSEFRVTDSPDKRGIDVALLYKTSSLLKYVGKKEYELKGKNFESIPSRNLLEVEFLVSGKHKLLVYVNHWPSQGAPAWVRVDTAKQLQQVIDAKLQTDSSYHVIALGDFNVIDGDHPHPFHSVLLDSKATNPLKDVDALFWKMARETKNDWKLRPLVPPGTYFYSTLFVWNLLDHFFVNDLLNDGKGLDVDVKSYRIHAPKSIQSTYEAKLKTDFLYGTVVTGIPKAYDIEATTAEAAGFSDHFPIVMNLITD